MRISDWSSDVCSSDLSSTTPTTTSTMLPFPTASAIGWGWSIDCCRRRFERRIRLDAGRRLAYIAGSSPPGPDGNPVLHVGATDGATLPAHRQGRDDR